MVLPTKLAPLQASFAVNVLSEEAYAVLKHTGRGGRWCLQPNDLNLVGTTSGNIDIKGIIHLPISLSKITPVIYLDIYIATNFVLLVDGLLGLPLLKSIHMTINPDNNFIQVYSNCLRTMVKAMCLASPWNGSSRQSVDTSVARATSPDSPPISLTDISKEWKTVNAVTIGDHVIPQKTAAQIPVSVPPASIGCDIYLEGPSHITTLAVEPTLKTVQDGNRTVAIVVNNTASPLRLKQVLLS